MILAFSLHCRETTSVTFITIRNVPDEVRDDLAARAARAGCSLQEHLRAELIDLARRPSVDQLLSQAESRKHATGARLSAERILAHRNAERE